MGHLKIIINFGSGIFFIHDFVYQIESSNSPKYICLSLAADRTEKKKKKEMKRISWENSLIEFFHFELFYLNSRLSQHSTFSPKSLKGSASI